MAEFEEWWLAQPLAKEGNVTPIMTQAFKEISHNAWIAAVKSQAAEIENLETGNAILVDMVHKADAEIERLKELLNMPEIEDFSKAVRLEAAHQVERWGSIDDRAKRPADWFWLVGYLAGKALHSQLGENRDKALHHCISTAAALCNWHAAIKGTDNRMRPGSSDVEKIVEQSFPGTVDSAKGKS